VFLVIAKNKLWLFDNDVNNRSGGLEKNTDILSNHFITIILYVYFCHYNFVMWENETVNFF